MINKEIRDAFEVMIKIDFLYEKLARQNNTTDATVKVLYYLETRNNISQKDICDDLLIPKQTVNTILSNFKKLNYVELVNVEGSKNKIIKYTKEGLEYSNKILSIMHEVELSIYKQLGSDKYSGLTKDLEKFYNLLRKEITHE